MNSHPNNHYWKYVIASINLILGVSVWFDYFTDYQIAVHYSEIWYPLIVGVIGFISLRYLVKTDQDRRLKLFHKLVSLPSIIGGLCNLLLLIPPMCIFSFIVLDNSAHEIRVEQEISPNGLQIASVYRGYAGAVDADDKVTIRIYPRWFPAIEREVYNELNPQWCTTDTSDCVQWIDNSTIQILGTSNRIMLSGVGFSLPLWLMVLILTIGLLFP